MTHTSTEQPEALRLAECLERDTQMNWPDYDNQVGAAAELRRLHTRVQELEAKVETGKRLLREEMARANRYAEAAQAQRVPPTEWLIAKAARVLSDRAAESCGIDAEDQWKIYAEVFKDDARAMLAAIGGITQEKQGWHKPDSEA